ncbi:MAG: TatD family hydrolase [Bacteroidaceae bacterium]|nr:TatD family hydrolase [Bacteroidaceae bacterium]MBQ9295066.1 TatD family hydrolase [Bacteroidaceae bacterium]
MYYIDFHTHQVPVGQDVVAVVDGRDTWGIHPWRASLSPVPSPKGKGELKSFPSGEDLGEALGEDLGEASRCLAIGECGLDALRGPSLSVQEEVFVWQVRLSESLGKPLIIHCVRAIDRLLHLRKSLRPKQSWMLHGFRGKPQQLRSLVDADLFVSFGPRHNEESLLLCPAERLMLETDADAETSIKELYNNVARKRGLEAADLCSLMAENYRAFFRKELHII